MTVLEAHFKVGYQVPLTDFTWIQALTKKQKGRVSFQFDQKDATSTAHKSLGAIRKHRRPSVDRAERKRRRGVSGGRQQ